MGARALRTGGTSLSGARRGPLLIAGVAAGVLVLGVALWLWRSSGPNSAGGGIEDDSAGSVAADGEARQIQPAPLRPPPRTPAVRRESGLDEAVQALGGELRNRRLWAAVSVDRVDPGIILVQSSLCEDAGMRDVIRAARSDLASRGGKVVRCLAPHGGVIFEETL